jgi:hypothetical protein
MIGKEIGMNVYILQHVHMRDDGDEDVKLIGVYSSMAKAEAAAERLRTHPGFADSPDGFTTDAYGIDQDQWTEGFVEVSSA